MLWKLPAISVLILTSILSLAKVNSESINNASTPTSSNTSLATSQRSTPARSGGVVTSFLRSDMAVSYDELLAPYQFSSDNVSGVGDALYPNPELLFDDTSAFDDTVDDTAADADFRGRDAIDNIMYIYYGSNYGAKSGIGVELVIIGCVCALAAQSITVILLCLRNRRLKKINALFPVILNLTSCMCVSNLIYIIGVQSTRSPLRCEMTALLLHYAHLVVAAWIFVFCYVISDHVMSDSVPNMRYNCLMAYGAPAIFVLFAYAVTPDSYESKNYCWMSVEKGMFLNYMLPVTLLIIVNTVFATFALKSVNHKIQNALTISIENMLDPASRYCGQKILTSELNLDEELQFEVTEWQCQKNAKPENSNKPNTEEYQRTIANGLEKPKTSDHKNPNIYVDIENAKYSADNPNIFYEVDQGKNYEYQTVVPHRSYDLDLEDGKENRHERVQRSCSDGVSCCEHSRIAERLDIANLSIGEFSLQSSDFPELSEFRKCLRFAVFLQPAFDVCWFLGVVAIENSSSTMMPVVFIICYNILSWLIFARSGSLCPLITRQDSDGSQSGGGGGYYANAAAASDDIPLLLNANSHAYAPGYTPAYPPATGHDHHQPAPELASCSHPCDNISTISN